jgi:predicted Zn finger-like uncharacterized protein
MNITCPNCGFGRSINEAKLPPKAVMATCPKCQHRFKFRDLQEASVPQDESQPLRKRLKLQWPRLAPPLRRLLRKRQMFRLPRRRPSPARPFPQHKPPAPREDDLWKELEALNDDEYSGHEAEESAQESLPAWEQATSDYPRAYARTFIQVLSRPKEFFSAMPVGHGFMKPLLFFLLIVQTVALTQSVWQLLGIVPPSLLTEGLGHTAQAALALILYPLEVSLFLFMDTAINHFFLRLFKADTKGFEGTFRAEAYSAAPMLLMIIPYIGIPLAMIGTTVYKFLGLRHVHGASNRQVLAVLILPMLLALVVAIVLTLITGQI